MFNITKEQNEAWIVMHLFIGLILFVVFNWKVGLVYVAAIGIIGNFIKFIGLMKEDDSDV